MIGFCSCTKNSLLLFFVVVVVCWLILLCDLEISGACDMVSVQLCVGKKKKLGCGKRSCFERERERERHCRAKATHSNRGSRWRRIIDRECERERERVR